MEKRTILAIALSFLILVGFQYVMKKYYPTEPPPQTVEDTAPEQEMEPAGTQPPPAVAESSPPAETSETDTPAGALQEIVVEDGLYRAVLSNRGAVLASWVLNDYKTTKEHNEFDLVAAVPKKGEAWPYPGSLYFENTDITKLANNELYEITVDGAPYSGSRLSPPVDVVMTLRRGDFTIRKTYSFEKDNYLVRVSSSVQKGGRDEEYAFFLGQDIGPFEEYIEGKRSKLEATYFDGSKVRRKSAPKSKDGVETISGNLQWVGLDMHYFTAIAIPDRTIASFNIRGFETVTEFDKDKLERSLISVKIPVDGSLDCLLYMGPKRQSYLKAVPGHELSRVINYGMFSILALPLLEALRWIHQYVNNYGFAIIILTLALSLLLLPLRLKQMFSMKKMQAIQPKVKAIQEKYKKYKTTDPKKAEMNQEVMALYREHKVNPMGGCLPLVVQMPLLFAFYSLLANSIELRQAPFIGWIHDLSAKDPYYVLPIVMGITMFLSQKITPMAPSADNSQAKMMQFLPIVFTFMFLSVSSGLNLYFLCSNISQVGFQKVYELIAGGRKNDSKPKRKK
jgi:YidC/Oxa1 family membrane protein insertase